MKEEIAVFAGGCFWCVETIFKRIKGVTNVVSGYTGGNIKSPTYEQVSSGRTGHAEAIQITFDPNEVSFTKLLQVFFEIHNPTTLNQQGADKGTQYRSAIFYASEKQKNEALQMIEKLTVEHMYPHPIVTSLEPLTVFYPAEDYHQNFYENNQDGMYCSVVITPKLRKFLQENQDVIKDSFTGEKV